MDRIEALLRHDRRVVVTALIVAAGLAWAWTLAGGGTGVPLLTSPRGSPGATALPAWDAAHALVMLAMWWLMMVAMMLPSAAPTILLATALNRRARPDRTPYGPAGSFTAGYLLAWLLFSVVAVGGQWALERAGLLSAMMATRSAWLAAGLLLAAGLWQLTPVKHACLRHCRSPLDFLVRHRRPGQSGALVMGLEHGAYCLGCCWVLMGLLFVGGVMNLYWIVGLALFVLIEKVAPVGPRFSRVSGIALVLGAVGLVIV